MTPKEILIDGYRMLTEQERRAFYAFWESNPSDEGQFFWLGWFFAQMTPAKWRILEGLQAMHRAKYG